jgi:hypothetical protein
MKFRCSTCKRRHNTTIHDALVASQQINPTAVEEEPTVPPAEMSPPLENVDGCAATCVTKPYVICDKYIPIVAVRLVSSSGHSVLTFAALDTCSQATLIKDSLARELGLSGPSTMLSIGSV